MALIPGICTQCGATLSADNTKDCMICPYCGTPFIVEKAINNFQNTYNISNSVVNFYGAKESDFVIRAGVLEKYNGPDTIVSVPDSVIAIGKSAFAGCIALEKVHLPDGLKEIGDWAFRSCASLSEISLSPNILTIGHMAFAGCIALEKVHLPDGLKEIGDGAFQSCEKLTNISLPDSVEKLGEDAFRGCKNLVEVRLPNNKYDPEKNYSSDDDGYRIPAFAFENCEKLELKNASVPHKSWYEALRGIKGYYEWENKEIEKDLKSRNLCVHCGGSFKGGLFGEKCTRCGRRKDY